MSSINGLTESQKNFLQGFAMGSDVARKVQGLPILSNSASNGTAVQLGPAGAKVVETANGSFDTPVVDHQIAAQNRFLSAGKKLSKEEQIKRDQDPLDIWGEMKRAASAKTFPQGGDVFRYKFHGLFYVAPNQQSFMCRLRIPGGEMRSWQFTGIANIADDHAAGSIDITTRANLQIREIPADQGCAVLENLAELGLVNKGSGADNVRNVTSSATSGIDPQELYDTLPLAKEMHHHILNTRALYRLPRKFNISFDGGGRIPTLDETNDLAFQAVRVLENNATQDVPFGVYFRMSLGGITGHEDFARSTGVLLKPSECVAVADAVLHVFLSSGDRTDRERARLKYVLDEWGFEKFLREVEQVYGSPLRKVESERYLTPEVPDRWAHVGVHPQVQERKSYIGLIFPVGRMTSHQARAIARIAERYGSGRIRLTVWQNLIIPDIDTSEIETVQAEIESIGLDWRASSIRSGLVACTGSKGCKFAAADTKGQAMQLAAYLEERLELDVPINIHFTGCPNSCAQHYIGDIGLRGTKVEVGDDLVDGYEVVVGGSFADRQNIARQLFAELPFTEIPARIESLLCYYLESRYEDESFSCFANRHDINDLQTATNRFTKLSEIEIRA